MNSYGFGKSVLYILSISTISHSICIEIPFKVHHKAYILNFISLYFPTDPDEITIFISCNQQGNGQEYGYNNNHNNQFKENLRESIYNQSILISKDNLINVYFLHEIFDQPGYWTFLNALPYIMFETNLVKPNTKWIILSEDLSSFDLHYLLNSLAKEDHNKVRCVCCSCFVALLFCGTFDEGWFWFWF